MCGRQSLIDRADVLTETLSVGSDALAVRFHAVEVAIPHFRATLRRGRQFSQAEAINAGHHDFVQRLFDRQRTRSRQDFVRGTGVHRNQQGQHDNGNERIAGS